MSYICLVGLTKEVKNKFLSLPRKIYDKKFLTQDIKAEKSILNGTHILSKDFDIYPFIVTDESGDIISRCLLTYYPDDDKGYVGFYESFDIPEASDLLLKSIEEKAKEDGKTTLIGPMDASFWIKYRFKISHFEKLYTGEPYNKEYYLSMWERFGFTITHRYSSNQGKVPTKYDVDIKCQKRFDQVVAAGYVFRNPTSKTFDEDLMEIYDLLIKLYSTFPGFKHITREQFAKLFHSLKFVLNFDMVTLAYKDKQFAGFFINVPNYGNATFHKITLSKMISILKTKKKPKEYILMYMGVDEGHLGLGGAFAEITKRQLEQMKQYCIGALIQDGKVTNIYHRSLVYDKYEYVLLGKALG